MGKKIFYTERDIEDLWRQGLTRLSIHDDVVLTDLAREKAAKLGLLLVAESPPANPPRPPSPAGPAVDDLRGKIKATVLARMGDQIPEALLEAIIPEVLAQLNLDK